MLEKFDKLLDQLIDKLSEELKKETTPETVSNVSRMASDLSVLAYCRNGIPATLGEKSSECGVPAPSNH